MSGKIAYLTRSISISSAHRLHSYKLSDAENLEIFGKCNNPNGHGHNYNIKVTVRGEISVKTGMVLNITELSAAMDKSILAQLDHKNLDLDVEYFRQHNIPSTTENLAVFIWESLKSTLKLPELLYKVEIFETDKNSVVYKGE